MKKLIALVLIALSVSASAATKLVNTQRPLFISFVNIQLQHLRAHIYVCNLRIPIAR